MTPANFTKDELWTALREASENLQAMRDFVDAQPHSETCYSRLTSRPHKQVTGCTCWKSRSPHFVRPAFTPTEEQIASGIYDREGNYLPMESNFDNLTRRVADAGKLD